MTISSQQDGMIFSNSLFFYFAREVEACSHLLASLCTCLQHLMTLRQWSDTGSLFPAGVHTAAELFATADTINQYCFYGRCLGVQVNVFHFIVIKKMSIKDKVNKLLFGVLISIIISTKSTCYLITFYYQKTSMVLLDSIHLKR